MISEGQSPEVLTKTNCIIRRIDLTCKLGAPVVTGFIISFVSLKASALTLALWNTISVWVGYWLFISVYNGIPALGQSNQKRTLRPSKRDKEKRPPTISEGKNTSLHYDDHEVLLESVEKSSWRINIKEFVSKVPYLDAWRVYLQQDVVLTGVALALLFFTVLR